MIQSFTHIFLLRLDVHFIHTSFSLSLLMPFATFFLDVDAVWIDHGIDGEGLNMSVLRTAHKLRTKERRQATPQHHVQIFGGFAFKYNAPMSPSQISKWAGVATSLFDVVTTSGSGTGHAIDQTKALAVQRALASTEGNAKLGCASGVSVWNIGRLWPLFDAFIVASGGTISTVDTNFKVHTFTGPGTFTVCSAGNAAGSNTVSYLVVAGAGGGGGSALGFYSGGGGGGGGFRESKAATDTYTASPLNATSGPTYNLPVSAQGYTITIGAGGSPGCSSGGNSAPGCRSPGGEGTNSVFSTITSARGGGGGESGSGPGRTPNGGVSGGSGGGGGGYNSNPDGGLAAGNTPSVSPPQGNSGGAGSVPSAGHGGGGGGATTAGTGTAGSPSAHANAGGAGAATSINGSSVTYANGGAAGACASSAATAGAVNSGIGGQGGNNYPPASNGALGGSGIVIIRYKFQ